jgi:mannose-6-phosphate isomerase-like protein (cupin superfamily)
VTSKPFRAVNLSEKLSLFDEHWSPRTVAQFNGHDVMVVKVKGEFVWHRHDDTDDLFLVLKGRIRIRLRDGEVELGPGELFVVPVGVEHQPVAAEEAELLLIEPSGAPNTGDAATAAMRRVICATSTTGAASADSIADGLVSGDGRVVNDDVIASLRWQALGIARGRPRSVGDPVDVQREYAQSARHERQRCLGSQAPVSGAPGNEGGAPGYLEPRRDPRA